MDNTTTFSPFIVGIGGTTKAASSSQKAIAVALRAAEALGAKTRYFDGPFLARLPIYDPENPQRTPEQQELVEAVRKSDGLILATPAYHAGISGLLKNGIDLLEDLRTDSRPYLDNRAVGCIVTAFGWQGGGTTLISVRTIVHALRGWPTPVGVTMNSAEKIFDAQGECVDEKNANQLKLLTEQVVEFSRRFASYKAK
jgi:FMN reductase